MGRRIKPFFENIEITDLAAEGKALVRINDIVVFVPWAVPGDIVDLQVVNKRKKFMEAMIVRFHKYSDLRIEPFCSHFSVCGGCKWQQLPYQEQTKQKQQQVVDAFEHIGKLTIPPIEPIIAADTTRYYRNKLEYTFSNQRWLTNEEKDDDHDENNLKGLGFHVPKRFDKVVDIQHCYLQPEPSNGIRLFIKEMSVELKVPFYNVRRQEGLLRNLIIRNNIAGDFMVILVVFSDFDELTVILDELSRKFPEIKSLHYVVNNKKNDDISDLDVIHYNGDKFYTDKIGSLSFKVGPKSFYQTNAVQAQNLYNVALDYAGLSGDELVYDLYTGTGTIACFVAEHCKKVVGIENIPEAIHDADENASINNITNTIFVAGDMVKTLTQEFIDEHGKPDIFITDPPRAGMHPQVIERLLETGAGKIVYISCNPATQARDIALMSEKYEIKRIQPIDMFPHTHHVENVVLLEKKI